MKSKKSRLLEDKYFYKFENLKKLAEKEDDKLLSRVIQIHPSYIEFYILVLNNNLEKTLFRLFPHQLNLFSTLKKIQIYNFDNFLKNIERLLRRFDQEIVKAFVIEKIDLKCLTSEERVVELFEKFKDSNEYYICSDLDFYKSKKEVINKLKEFKVYPSLDSLIEEKDVSISNINLYANLAVKSQLWIQSLFAISLKRTPTKAIEFLKKKNLPASIYTEDGDQLAYELLEHFNIKSISLIKKLTKLDAYWEFNPKKLSQILVKINSKKVYKYFLNRESTTLFLLYYEAFKSLNSEAVKTLSSIAKLNQKELSDLIINQVVWPAYTKRFTMCQRSYEKLIDFFEVCSTVFKKDFIEVIESIIQTNFNKKVLDKKQILDLEERALLAFFISLCPDYKKVAHMFDKPLQIDFSMFESIRKAGNIYKTELDKNLAFQLKYIQSILISIINEDKISDLEILKAASLVIKHKHQIEVDSEVLKKAEDSNLSDKSKQIIKNLEDIDKLKRIMNKNLRKIRKII